MSLGPRRYTLALCCNCCGGDRTQACCCPAKRKTVRPDALSAQPAYAHDDGMPDAEKGGGDSGLTIGGTHIPEATMSKYTLAFLILCMVCAGHSRATATPPSCPHS